MSSNLWLVDMHHSIHSFQKFYFCVFGLLWAFFSMSCTSVDLRGIVDYDPPSYQKQSIQANVCAPEPVIEDAPYKILFVIDTSYSNYWNDPDGRREIAVRNAISEYINNESISFGIITFSDEPRRQTYGYTRDIVILNGATENISAAQGGTNYSDTQWAMIDFILQDTQNLSESELARTHYLNFWLSDGIPTVGVTDTNALVPGVEYLINQLKDRVAEIKFNTLYLGGVPPTTEEEMEESRMLLKNMANAGEGSYTNIPAGEDFSFDVEPVPLVHIFELYAIVANNLHARLNEAQPVPDSDGDGLSDIEEQALYLDVCSRDSDGDGYSDGIEHRLYTRLDPLEYNSGCDTPTLDSDRDGLTDCEEILVGTAPNNPDTDGDYLLDSIELLAGTSALVDDPMLDFDMDGIGDAEEVLLHLPARVPTYANTIRKWSYQYTVYKNKETSTPQRPCYDITVENMWMGITQADDTHPEGGNIIKLFAAFEAPTAQIATRFFQAEMRGIYLEPDNQDPPDGRFKIESMQFEKLENK